MNYQQGLDEYEKNRQQMHVLHWLTRLGLFDTIDIRYKESVIVNSKGHYYLRYTLDLTGYSRTWKDK